MTTLTGGAAVVQALEAEDVDVVFGIPGTHNLEFYRHLPASRLRHITPRHEQGAGYAADGYARVSGRPAVCVTTGGPGLTNIVTAVATAYADSVPLMVISPGVPRGAVRADLGLLHELRDQRGMMAGVVDRAVRVESATEATTVIREAFADWAVTRPRPVYLEVPVDVLEEEWDGLLPDGRAPAQTKALDGELIAGAASLLAGAERPVVILGGGARKAAAPALALVQRLGAPVVTSVNGKGIIAESSDYSLGASLRTTSAQEFLGAADVALVVGSELGDSDLWDKHLTFRGDVIRIDIDPNQAAKNATPAVAIINDAATVLEALLAELVTRPTSGTSQAAKVHEVRDNIHRELESDGDVWRDVQAIVSECFPGPVIVAGDSAMVSYFGTAHHWSMGPQDRFIYPTGYATLGYGLPAAIGASIASPGTDVVVLVGDGGFMFSLQELVTAVEQELAIPIVVVNNGGYRAIRDQMVERGMTPTGVDLMTPEFATLAEACGARGVRLDGLTDLAASLRDAQSASTPTLIEVLLT